MKKIFKIAFYLLLLVLSPTSYVFGFSSGVDNSKTTLRSIWKYEQDYSKYSDEEGIAKKIYFLSLNSDGTYHQYIQVVPSNPKNYYHVKNYEIEGKWSEKDGKLILNEYGKESSIDYNFIYSNFENIDNQFISK